MNKRRMGKVLTVLLSVLLVCLAIVLLVTWNGAPRKVPGLTGKERTLLRIWVVDAPGGAVSWLKGQLRTFEKQHPGLSTYLRTVDAAELSAPDAVLPDMVLYMPGNVTVPETLFVPMTGEVTVREDGLIREELLRCGRWQGMQYGLPLCWAGWVLAIDSALEPGTAVTPAPTTLLGKPVSTDGPATQEPGYPMEEAMQAEHALQAPAGTALFTLGLLLEHHPPLPEDFAALSSGEVYAAFQKRQCATAMLTTGQVTAFEGIVSGGGGFPFRVMTAEEVITDQVWLASITPDAPKEAAWLLAHLTSAEAQTALSSQGLFTVRRDMTLYASGMPAKVERAGRSSLAAINAYIPAADVLPAAWQFFQGTSTLDEALLPLL